MPSKKVKTTKKAAPIKKVAPTKKVSTTKKGGAAHFTGGQGKMSVRATFNSTYVSFSDTTGNIVCWSSAGTCGFKGARRSTPFAATTILEEGLRKAKSAGLTGVDVFLKGPGPGKDAALRVLKTSGLDINLIADITPIPHNGCRPKKPRRV